MHYETLTKTLLTKAYDLKKGLFLINFYTFLGRTKKQPVLQVGIRIRYLQVAFFLNHVFVCIQN